MSNIASELRRLASQENCDGEPYNSMMKAAAYIERLEAALKEALAIANERGNVDLRKRETRLVNWRRQAQHALAEPPKCSDPWCGDAYPSCKAEPQGGGECKQGGM